MRHFQELLLVIWGPYNSWKCLIYSYAIINGINQLHSAWTSSLEHSMLSRIDSLWYFFGNYAIL